MISANELDDTLAALLLDGGDDGGDRADAKDAKGAERGGGDRPAVGHAPEEAASCGPKAVQIAMTAMGAAGASGAVSGEVSGEVRLRAELGLSVLASLRCGLAIDLATAADGRLC